MRVAGFAVIMALLAAMAMAQCPPAGVGNWCSGTYLYDGMGNVTDIGADNYVYDELGRLKNGTADVQRSGRLNRQNYEYDLFGNRTNTYRDGGSVDCLGGCELSPPLAVSIYTNHLTNHNAQYDEAGNLTRIDAATYAYDGAGSLARAISTDDRQFLYTADDERLATRNGLSWTWTVRGLDQKVLREFTSAEVNGLPNANRQWAKDYVWRDGQLLASVAPGGSGNVIEHYHLDHLGTARVVSNTAGVRLGDHAYYPFGAELMVTPHETPEELMKFAGHERDIQGNDAHTLDMMHARYEMATLGRFMSIDPAQNAVLEAPQSWNRYSHVRNNPLNLLDPDGRDVVYANAYARAAVTSARTVSPGTDAVFTEFECDPNRRVTVQTGNAPDPPGATRLAVTKSRIMPNPDDKADQFIMVLDQNDIERTGADTDAIVIHETVGHLGPNSRRTTKEMNAMGDAARESDAQQRTVNEIMKIAPQNRPTLPRGHQQLPPEPKPATPKRHVALRPAGACVETDPACK